MPGVRQVVVLDDVVAVIGDHTWAAKQGLAELEIEWDDGPNAKISSADVWTELRAAARPRAPLPRKRAMPTRRSVTVIAWMPPMKCRSSPMPPWSR